MNQFSKDWEKLLADTKAMVETGYQKRSLWAGCDKEEHSKCIYPFWVYRFFAGQIARLGVHCLCDCHTAFVNLKSVDRSKPLER